MNRKRAMQPDTITEINKRFERSWESMSKALSHEKGLPQDTKRAVRRLKRCLRWCTAYSILQTYCGNIIKLYEENAALIIKKFWIDYWSLHFYEDIPPTPKEFFEWYCDSDTIEEERAITRSE